MLCSKRKLKSYVILQNFRNLNINWGHICWSNVWLVWLLQAAYRMRVRLRQRDRMEPGRRDDRGRSGLHKVEQWPRSAMLFLRLVQGRRPGKPQEELEEGFSDQHHPPYHSCDPLPCWFGRVSQKSKDRQQRTVGREPDDQVATHLDSLMTLSWFECNHTMQRALWVLELLLFTCFRWGTCICL